MTQKTEQTIIMIGVGLIVVAMIFAVSGTPQGEKQQECAKLDAAWPGLGVVYDKRRGCEVRNERIWITISDWGIQEGN